MFSYIFATNTVTGETDACIEMLEKIKGDNDKIIVINYNRNHLSYRKGNNGIDYRHIKMGRSDAINSVLPECGNVVVFGKNTTITKTFVKDLNKFYDRHTFQTLRQNKSMKGGKYVESDYRIGSLVVPSSFNNTTVAFSAKAVPEVHDDLSRTASIAKESGITLRLLANVKTMISTETVKKRSKNGITIIIPSKTHKLSPKIKDLLTSNDQIIEFDENPRVLANLMGRMANKSRNDCVVVISPQSTIFDSSILNRIRSLFGNCENMLFDNSLDTITNNAWLVTNKKTLIGLPRSLNTTTSLITHVVKGQKNLVRYNENSESMSAEQVLVANTNNSISIIIPFKYQKERWPLFEASITNLYEKTKDYDNIEIVVHEASDKRMISPDMVKKLNLEYLFSKYTETFHKSWVMNIACKYVANGDTFVFFDADMIVDSSWVIELLNSDKTKCLYGWGRIFNLTKDATDQYLKDGTISNDVVKVSKPNIKTSAGGITLMPRKDFFKVGGWLESYKNLGYGGQDNSMAYKLSSLGMYNLSFINCSFSSSIWHLYHDHQIIKHPRRLNVHKSHSEFSTQNWLDYIDENYVWGIPTDSVNVRKFDDDINEGLIYSHMRTNKTNLTVCVLVDRVDSINRVIRSLLSTGVKMNVVMWVHDSKDTPSKVKNSISTSAKGFTSFEITYSGTTQGYGYPYLMMCSKVAYEYTTPYVMVMNSNTLFDNPQSVVMGSTTLRQDKNEEIGAVAITPKSKKNGLVIGKVSQDAITIRHEILKNIIVDPNYNTPLLFDDIGKMVRKRGWEVATISKEDYNPSRYVERNISMDNGYVKDNNLFKGKWGY